MGTSTARSTWRSTLQRESQWRVGGDADRDVDSYVDGSGDLRSPPTPLDHSYLAGASTNPAFTGFISMYRWAAQK